MHLTIKDISHSFDLFKQIKILPDDFLISKYAMIHPSLFILKSIVFVLMIMLAFYVSITLLGKAYEHMGEREVL